MYIQYIQGLFQSRLGTADYALVTSSLHYSDSLDTWTVIHMTAAKFKEHNLSYISNRFIPYLTGNTLRLRYKAQPINAQEHNLSYISNRLIPYLTGNTLRLRYKAQPVNII
jgi:hypothetical protein